MYLEKGYGIMDRKICLALGAIHFPLSMASYFIRAFERREDVELWLFGPFTGAYIPWAGGMRIPPKYVKVPHFALPRETIGLRISSGIINSQMPWTPDLTLLIDAGWHTSDRPAGRVVAHVQTDPHVLKLTYKLPKSYSDVSFCMQQAYIEKGEEYLPYGFDPTVHYPMDLEKVYDACLIGLQYEHRNQLVSRLRQRNLNVYYTIGEIYDEYRERYNSSRVALSWSSMEDTPARVFEAFGMSMALVANRTPDLSNFFLEGEDYLGFGSVDEAEKQVFTLLLDDERRAEIGYNAYRKALAGHTWDIRVNQILNTCGLV